MALIILRVVNDINEKLHVNAVAMQMQVGMSEDFNAIIDLLTRKMATLVKMIKVSPLPGLMFLQNT